ncbi:unnamed protein product [Lathyrus sativus]|nr:unnamed protein product [Lathyrus sativus]
MFFNPKNLFPKHLFHSKKEKSSVSRSDPLSFGSSSSSDESTHKVVTGGSQTPTSVLPEASSSLSSDVTIEVQWELAQAFWLIDRNNNNDNIVQATTLFLDFVPPLFHSNNNDLSTTTT